MDGAGRGAELVDQRGIRRWPIQALAVLAAWAALLPAQAGAADFRLCTSDEWPPYVTIEAGQIGGSHTERIRAAFRRMNQPVEIVSLPWARCLADVGSGDEDGAYSAAWTAERAATALYPTVPLGAVSYVFVTRRDGVDSWAAAHDPRNLPQPIAAPHGYSILAALHALDGVQVVDHLATDEADLEALLRGEVGAIAIEASVARYIAGRAHVADKIAILDPPLAPGKKYFMIVSRRYGGGEAAAAAFTERFSTALGAVAAE